MRKTSALQEAKEILIEVKEIISELNVFVAKYSLLPVEEIAPELQSLCPVKKPLTSILEISIACDEQIGKLDDYTSLNAKEKTGVKENV